MFSIPLLLLNTISNELIFLVPELPLKTMLWGRSDKSGYLEWLTIICYPVLLSKFIFSQWDNTIIKYTITFWYITNDY